jgi:PPE-repeat protein
MAGGSSRLRAYFWMGAATLAVGTGVALAGGSGIAHADSSASGSTGHHQRHASAAASSSKNAGGPTVAGRRLAPKGSVTAKADNTIDDQKKDIADQKAAIAEQREEFATDVRKARSLNFFALPPEITSTLMFAGSGAAPMLAAASGWNELADELNAASAGLERSLEWLFAKYAWGPVSGPVSAAGHGYAGWLSTTAGQAMGAANSASAAAAAFTAAFEKALQAASSAKSPTSP